MVVRGRRFFKFDAGFFGEDLQGFVKFKVLIFHQELERVAALAAAEAVPDLPVGRDHKGSRLFVVKRTAAFEVAAGGRKFDILLDEFNYVDSGFDLFNWGGHYIIQYQYTAWEQAVTRQ